MTDELFIKDGTLYSKVWNRELREYEVEKVPDQKLSTQLQKQITFNGKVTFADFWAFIDREAELFAKIFAASMGNHPLAPYQDEMKEPALDDGTMTDVVIGWCAESSFGDFEFYTDFSGHGPWTESDAKTFEVPLSELEGTCRFAIEYTPLFKYKHLELRLDPSVTLYWPPWKSGEDFDKKRHQNLGNRAFTAYDIIHAILFEITWAGLNKARTRVTLEERLAGDE